MNPILDHPLISQRYFFPRADRPPQIFAVQAGPYQLNCYREAPLQDAPTLLHFHGNGEVVADYVGYHSKMFLEMGCNVFFAEYRGYGGSGGEPALAGMLDDVDAIVEAIGEPASDLIVFGRSVGSIYAIELAHRYPEIAGLVLESGIADVLERILLRVTPRELGCTLDELEAEARKHLNHEAKLGSYANPALIMHAHKDHLVDYSHARRNFDWCASRNKRLVGFDRGDHNSIFGANAAEYTRELRGFIESL